MTKKTTTTPGKRPQIQASIEPKLFERIKAEAEGCFNSVSAIVEARLNASYATEGELPKTAFADTKERSAAADLEIKQLRLSQLRREVIRVDEAVKVAEDCFGEMRTEGLAFVDDISREFGLNAEDLRRRFLEVMAGPFAVNAEPFEKLADEFSREPLP